MSSRSAEFDSYRGSHQPPSDGVPLHDVSELAHGDVYRDLRHYTHGGGTEPADRESIAVVQALRGQPHAMVTVYRAAPHGVGQINPGDWVTPSLSYAKQHARHSDDPAQDWPVHAARVQAQHVRNGGNDIIEWGYQGPEPVPAKAIKPPKRGWE